MRSCCLLPSLQRGQAVHLFLVNSMLSKEHCSCISPWLAPIPLDSSLELCVGQAQTSVQLRHWMDSWWQIEDSALWCLLGHVWQLANPGSAGEAEARQAAGVARRNRLAAEARLHAEQMRLQAGLDPDAAEQEQVTD
jgi:hypothetical protein